MKDDELLITRKRYTGKIFIRPDDPILVGGLATRQQWIDRGYEPSGKSQIHILKYSGEIEGLYPSDAVRPMQGKAASRRRQLYALTMERLRTPEDMLKVDAAEWHVPLDEAIADGLIVEVAPGRWNLTRNGVEYVARLKLDFGDDIAPENVH